jgi:quinol monooxygenase YgiN
MIELKVVIDVPAAERPAFIPVLRDLMQKSQAEAGCVYYRFTTDLDNDNRFHLTEEWASEDALRTHMKTPHLAQFVVTLVSINGAIETVARIGELTPYQLRRAKENA